MIAAGRFPRTTLYGVSPARRGGADDREVVGERCEQRPRHPRGCPAPLWTEELGSLEAPRTATNRGSTHPRGPPEPLRTEDPPTLEAPRHAANRALGGSAGPRPPLVRGAYALQGVGGAAREAEGDKCPASPTLCALCVLCALCDSFLLRKRDPSRGCQ